jgi:hypothetical protein
MFKKKEALQSYSKCYYVVSGVKKIFTLIGIQSIHPSTTLTMDRSYACKRFRNTRHTVTFGVPV